MSSALPSTDDLTSARILRTALLAVTATIALILIFRISRGGSLVWVVPAATLAAALLVSGLVIAIRLSRVIAKATESDRTDVSDTARLLLARSRQWLSLGSLPRVCFVVVVANLIWLVAAAWWTTPALQGRTAALLFLGAAVYFVATMYWSRRRGERSLAAEPPTTHGHGEDPSALLALPGSRAHRILVGFETATALLACGLAGLATLQAYS